MSCRKDGKHQLCSCFMSFRRIGKKWRISTPAHLVIVPGCGDRPFASGCPAGSKILVLILDVSHIESSPAALRIATPVSVRRAGGRELQEFDAGRRAAAASGCAACHRIGESGNRGPGPSLTHVGSRLTEREIRHFLLDPKAPMPSFRGLPRRKLHALIRFLALLK